MNSMINNALVAATIMAAAGTVSATSVQNTTGIAGATGTITFSEESLSDSSPVTTQFAADGASFTPYLVKNPQYGFLSGDFVGNFGYGNEQPTFDIDFTHAVSGAAIELVTNPNTTTFEALLNGTVVGEFSASTSTGAGSYYGFDGFTFDTLRVSVGGDGNMLMDNVEFRSAVPEPTSLALMSLGLAALAMRARRKA